MIIGLGIDIVEIHRIKHHFGDLSSTHCVNSFTKRVLTPLELEEIQKRFKTQSGKVVQYVAGRFAVKEAFAKAMGQGVGASFSFQDVTVLNNEKGSPILSYSNNLSSWMQSKSAQAHVSISHENNYAVSTVILST